MTKITKYGNRMRQLHGTIREETPTFQYLNFKEVTLSCFHFAKIDAATFEVNMVNNFQDITNKNSFNDN